MTETGAETRTVTMERELAHPPEKVWRALTQPQLLAEWLMKTDFAPEPGRSFTFTGEWGSVDCKLLEIDEPRRLAYTWDALGIESVVTWTLTPTASGTHLTMEQTGFRPDQEQAFQGARFGWTALLAKLDTVLASLD